MSDLNELYQQVILDHYKRPRNWGRPQTVDREAEGYNPLCGDHIKVYVMLDRDVIRDVHVEGTGCAIAVASASMMSEALRGKTIAEAAALFEKFHHIVLGDAANNGNGTSSGIGKLAVFAGVSKFPVRVKCATLAWHTVNAAIAGRHDTVSTE